MHNHSFPDLERLVRPRSVALVGASATPGSMGHRTLANLRITRTLDEDRIHLVNPSRDTIDGLPCHPDLASLPETPDVAVIVVPGPAVLPALEQCAARKVPFAVILSSGFGETGDDGAAVQRRISELAADSGTRIYGPNCPGLVNLADRVGMSFSPAFATDRITGPLGIATQGGGLGRNLIQAGERGVGTALWASVGNAADLDVPDFIHHMAGDERISVVLTVLEGIRDGGRLLAAAESAAEAGKPVVALKVGRSELGARAVRSHTAALAGSAAVTSTAFRRAGIVEAGDLDEMIDVAWLLSRAPAPAHTPRLAVFGGSGGALAFAADLAGAAGLELAEFTEETTARLREVLPHFAAVGNPVDTTATVITDPDLTDQALRAVAADPGVDLVLLPIPLDYGELSTLSCHAMVEAQQHSATPLLPVWMSDRRGPGHQVLAEGGLAPVHSLDKAMLAITRWAGYGAWLAARIGEPAPAPLALGTAGSVVTSPLPDVTTEPAAKAWLAAHGIPVPDGVVARDAEDTRAAAARLGGPLVLKGVSTGLPHKTEAGAVAVGLTTPEEAVAARERILRSVADRAPDAVLDGVLVERMAPDDGVEMLVGVHRDPVFGHLLTVGLGGIHVEVLKDVERELLPLDAPRAHAMLRRLRAWPLLDGVRGRPRCDVDALVELLLAVSRLVSDHADGLDSLDLNPVRVRPVGAGGPGALVLDALVVPATAP
ncbi:acetate--CoA ligase family protein [Streptomyces sp. NPDC048277]|uniref:acetate--CoA ligase family protein n=1 Tax=Streptomyces sp. NPDC048277 TaxID=3155027 RepID=UPI0033E422BF